MPICLLERKGLKSERERKTVSAYRRERRGERQRERGREREAEREKERETERERKKKIGTLSLVRIYSSRGRWRKK